MFYKTMHPSPIGTLTLASDGEVLVGLWMEGQKYHGDTIYNDMIIKDDLLVFDDTKKWLDKYFAGVRPNQSDIRVAPIGSEFRRKIWGYLCEIPYGTLPTYGEIAKKIAPGAGNAQTYSRAVGGAVGHNPISIIIPCHRVVGSDGCLTGFSAGLHVKIKLLELEGVDMSGLSTPKSYNR